MYGRLFPDEMRTPDLSYRVIRTIALKAMFRRVRVNRSPDTAKPAASAMFPAKEHIPSPTNPSAHRLPTRRILSVSG